MKHILVIEDDTTISLVLRTYLEREGYIVKQVYSCKEAIDSFSVKMPDLVLLDIMLPDENGWTILQKIRERSACPVIMLTALGDIHNKLDGLNQGADDYISKPFIGEEVVARVNTVLRRTSRIWSRRTSPITAA